MGSAARIYVQALQIQCRAGITGTLDDAANGLNYLVLHE